MMANHLKLMTSMFANFADILMIKTKTRKGMRIRTILFNKTLAFATITHFNLSNGDLQSTNNTFKKGHIFKSAE